MGNPNKKRPRQDEIDDLQEELERKRNHELDPDDDLTFENTDFDDYEFDD